MKKIEAIIQAHKVEEVKQALIDVGMAGITITDVRGHGRQGGHTELYRGAEYTVDLMPKAKLELVVPAESVDEVVAAIRNSARTGQIGDGKIFVLDIDDAVRIRNGEIGRAAL